MCILSQIRRGFEQATHCCSTCNLNWRGVLTALMFWRGHPWRLLIVGLKHAVFNTCEAATSIIDCHDGGQNPMASNSSIPRSHTMTDLKKDKLNVKGLRLLTHCKIDITRGKIEWFCKLFSFCPPKKNESNI